MSFSSVKSFSPLPWYEHLAASNQTQITEPNLKFSNKKRDFNHLQDVSAKCCQSHFWWKNLEFEEHVPAITTFLVAARQLFTPRNTNSIRKAAVSIAWKAYKWCSSGPSSIVIQGSFITNPNNAPGNPLIFYHAFAWVWSPQIGEHLMTPCHNDSNIPKNLHTVNLSTPFPFFHPRIRINSTGCGIT